MRRRSLSLLLLVLVTVLAPAVVSAQEASTLPPWRRELPEGRAQAEIIVGDTPLTVDLAIDPGEQTLGLGYRNGLEPGTGMLFVNDTAANQTFWMKGMRFCLDIIWITDGQIVGAAENACPDPAGTLDAERARYSSGMPVSHILEVPAGWMAEQGYGPGTPVDLSGIPN